MTISIGEKAPDFSLEAQNGQPIRLSDFRGKSIVVLFFYPRDHTPVCTSEACQFRDEYSNFVDAGATVLGISKDSIESHGRFAGDHKLPYALLSDVSGEVHKIYGLKQKFNPLPKRVSFVIDYDGVVRWVFDSMFKPETHVLEALKIVRSIQGEARSAPV